MRISDWSSDVCSSDLLTMPAGTGLPSSNCVSCFLYLSVSGGNIVRGSTTFGPSSNTVRAFEHSAKVLKPTRRPMPLWLTPPNGRYGLVPDCTTLWLSTMLPEVVFFRKNCHDSRSFENTYEASGLSRPRM